MQVYCDRMITADLVPQSFRICVPKPLSVDILQARGSILSWACKSAAFQHPQVIADCCRLPFAGGCCLCSDTNELFEQGSGPVQHSDCLADLLRHVHNLDHYCFSYPVSSEPP